MSNTEKKRFNMQEVLWEVSPDGESHLIGSKCRACGEIYFPKKDSNWCVHCNKKEMEDITLSNRGKIGSFAIVMIPPAGGFYIGQVPYTYGSVDLPEGVRVETQFTETDPENIKVGMDAELVIDKLGNDEEGNEVLTFRFKPVGEVK